ncbi:MAG: aminopeptidase [Melioribacteraceae bacterium]
MKKKLFDAAKIAIKDCMGLKKKEKVLVITDSNKKEIGEYLFQAALDLGAESLLVETKPGKTNGEEPTSQLAELMKKYDIVLCPTTKSLTHTNARRAASASGVRVATFPGITEEIMIRGLNADYKAISNRTNKLKRILEKVSTVRVTTKLGTDITMEMKGRGIYASKGLFHKKTESGNLPTGETFLAPWEGKTNGVFVVDGSFAGIGMLEKPITIQVKNGLATEISGDKKAKQLIDMLKPFGKNGRNIAEFGIGTNDKAKLSGYILEDEKVMGTIHIALGDNKSMGGSINVPIHVDGVIKKPTVYFDDKIIMKDGKFVINL